LHNASVTSNATTVYSSAHFKFEFKTKQGNGILYYAEGQPAHLLRVYDYEGVYLRNGRLHYFLFNPAEYSIGSTFGFHGKSRANIPLNDGKLHSVSTDFFVEIVF